MLKGPFTSTHQLAEAELSYDPQLSAHPVLLVAPSRSRHLSHRAHRRVTQLVAN